MRDKQETLKQERPPIRWTGVLFALAANLLLLTLLDTVLLRTFAEIRYQAVIVAPIMAGVLTAVYVRQRGAVHAFLGGVLSAPVIGLFVFPGAWGTAILAAAFCTLGGALTELIARRKQ